MGTREHTEETYVIFVSRKFNCIGHIWRINFLLRDAIESQMTEMKGVGKRTQLLDDLIIRRRYWELKKKLKIEENGKGSLSIEHKYGIFHKSLDLLISSLTYLVIIMTDLNISLAARIQ